MTVTDVICSSNLENTLGYGIWDNGNLLVLERISRFLRDFGNLLLYLEILGACWFLGGIRLLVSGRCWLIVGYWEILVDCWFLGDIGN